MRKTAVIGVGNMASAIIGGIIASGLGEYSDLVLYDKLAEKLSPFAEKGSCVADSIRSAVESAECVLLAVKPQNLAEVGAELAEVDLSGKLFISILAGMSTEIIAKKLAQDVAIVRVMPNTPLQIGLGVTALAKNARVSDAEFDFACRIFETSGMILKLDESQMNTVICVNGSSPAYFYYFIDAMVKSAKAQGLECDGIVEAVCRTVIGSAEMLMRSGKTPEELIRAVTSPKGTTERAMNELRDSDVAGAIDRAMKACTARAEEMAREMGE